MKPRIGAAVKRVSSQGETERWTSGTPSDTSIVKCSAY